MTVREGGPCFNTSTSTEGPALLYHKGAYYIFGSHLTGLDPNPARLLRCVGATLEECCGAQWEDLGNPAVGPATTPEGDGPETTFNAQSTFVLPLEHHHDSLSSNAVAVWMGDRWEPDPVVAPGGQRNATYVWLSIEEGNAGRREPPLVLRTYDGVRIRRPSAAVPRSTLKRAGSAPGRRVLDCQPCNLSALLGTRV